MRNDAGLRKLADPRALRPFRDQFGRGSWTRLGPGEVSLFPRGISTQEIHSFDLELAKSVALATRQPLMMSLHKMQSVELSSSYQPRP